MRRVSTKVVSLLAAMACVAPLASGPSQAQHIGEALAAKLSLDQQRAYVLHLRARAAFERELQAYWAEVDAKRDNRKRKRSARQPFTARDYVATQPPTYAGPALPPDVAKIVAKEKPPTPDDPLPVVADFLSAALKHYGFRPTPTKEAEFKRRYAAEALALGLAKEQVVRVYALETGGRGTFDMQAGVDPETKKGRAISSALGYAQLLCANSVGELVKHGEAFIQRLNTMAAARGTSKARAAALRAKAKALRRMLIAARRVPNAWSAHVAMSRTPRGYGIHAINLDADIGPWLQVIKLKGLREIAERAGRGALSGAEIELMNLAGPATGLEMMDPVARGMPTTNFFSYRGYYRNTIVRGKTAAQLLAALDERMEIHLKKPGSIEFARAFDALSAKRRGVASK
ncbi:MAG: hypothetical protein R3D68_14965 [Hyphomicrobiaceae bacterium]